MTLVELASTSFRMVDNMSEILPCKLAIWRLALIRALRLVIRLWGPWLSNLSRFSEETDRLAISLYNL